MIKIGIIGASGYTGGELLRLLSQHPKIEVTAITSRTHEGKRLEEVFPSFNGWNGPCFTGSDSAAAVAGCEVVFLAVPHGVAMKLAPDLLANGQRVIDLGADFRFREPEVFETWYQHQHSAAELTRNAVYGLPELHRQEIREANLVGNPGCYPTSIILGSFPLLKEGLVAAQPIIIDAKSGVSGAGRKAELDYHYPELFGNFKAYKVTGHRHTPEIEQELSLIAKKELLVSFTPHLLPVSRGILSTLHFTLTKKVTTTEVEELFCETYRCEPFVKVMRAPGLPELKMVTGTNFCMLGVRVDERTNQVIVVSVIDNLVKGAAGQAIQNMNIMCDLPEAMGLENWALYP